MLVKKNRFLCTYICGSELIWVRIEINSHSVRTLLSELSVRNLDVFFLYFNCGKIALVNVWLQIFFYLRSGSGFGCKFTESLSWISIMLIPIHKTLFHRCLCTGFKSEKTSKKERIIGRLVYNCRKMIKKMFSIYSK